MLDFDLAALSGVATKVLNQAVKRNRGRFPDDFMFQLSAGETANLKSQFEVSISQGVGDKRIPKNRSQFVTGPLKHRELRSRPYGFTEQGVAMFSSVLNSERAVRVLFLIAFLLNIAGMALLGIGLIISFPVSLLAIAGFYRSLQPATV